MAMPRASITLFSTPAYSAFHWFDSEFVARRPLLDPDRQPARRPLALITRQASVRLAPAVPIRKSVETFQACSLAEYVVSGVFTSERKTILRTAPDHHLIGIGEPWLALLLKTLLQVPHALRGRKKLHCSLDAHVG